MGAGEPNLPVSPGVFIFTAERLKLPSSGPISQSCPWNESLSRPVPGPLVPKLENWRRNFLSPLLLLPPRVSVPGQPRSLAALPQRTNHRSAFFPTSEGGARTRGWSPALAPYAAAVESVEVAAENGQLSRHEASGKAALAPASFPSTLRPPLTSTRPRRRRRSASPLAEVSCESQTNGRGNYLSGLFQVFGSLPHHSAPSLLPPRLAPGVVFRSLSSERAPPTVTSARWAGEVTWRVTPTHHEPGPGLASAEHAALPGRPP